MSRTGLDYLGRSREPYTPNQMRAATGVALLVGALALACLGFAAHDYFLGAGTYAEAAAIGGGALAFGSGAVGGARWHMGRKVRQYREVYGESGTYAPDGAKPPVTYQRTARHAEAVLGGPAVIPQEKRAPIPRTAAAQAAIDRTTGLRRRQPGESRQAAQDRRAGEDAVSREVQDIERRLAAPATPRPPDVQKLETLVPPSQLAAPENPTRVNPPAPAGSPLKRRMAGLANGQTYAPDSAALGQAFARMRVQRVQTDSDSD